MKKPTKIVNFYRKAYQFLRLEETKLDERIDVDGCVGPSSIMQSNWPSRRMMIMITIISKTTIN